MRQIARELKVPLASGTTHGSDRVRPEFPVSSGITGVPPLDRTNGRDWGLEVPTDAVPSHCCSHNYGARR